MLKIIWNTRVKAEKFQWRTTTWLQQGEDAENERKSVFDVYSIAEHWTTNMNEGYNNHEPTEPIGMRGTEITQWLLSMTISRESL